MNGVVYGCFSGGWISSIVVLLVDEDKLLALYLRGFLQVWFASFF